MTTNLPVADRVAILHRLGLVALIAGYITAAALRLNDCDLFNPDSPRYLIYAQSIVNLGEYRATDLPGAPVYTWRPPGLPLLLAPILALRPYDVIAAKCMVLLCGILLLWGLFHLTKLHSGPGGAILMTALVATSPLFLLLSTEVLSEVPYAVGVLGVILVISQWDLDNSTSEFNQSRQATWKLISVCFVMTLIPWVRTAGVSLIAAVGVWTLMRRQRARCWFPVVCAIAGLAILAWRNQQAAGENYVGSLLQRLQEQGFWAVARSSVDTIRFYFSSWPSLVLPEVTPQRAMYSPVAVDPLPNLMLPASISLMLSSVLLGFSVMGMWQRRSRGGSLALLYTFAYCGCLLLWPWRHERFLWPLLPVLLAFLPAGFAVLPNRIVSISRDLVVCGSFCLIALCIWQGTIGSHLIRDNFQFWQQRATFYSHRFPSFYYSNWRQAGSWLKENSADTSRVLTWHAAVGETAHRYQKRVAFETLTPDRIRQQIQQFAARFLVVPAAQFGDGFGWQQLAADPAIHLRVVHQDQDVAILEVIPNRTGEVSKEAYPRWLGEQLAAIDVARKQWPGRIDLAIRHAGLLREAGRDLEALQLLQSIYERGIATVRVCSELAGLLYDQGDFGAAAQMFELAGTLPNSESIAPQLAEGAARSRQRLAEGTAGQPPSLERRIKRLQNMVNLLKLARAEEEANQLVAEFPDQPEVNFLNGKIHHLLGDLPTAESRYERAMHLGSPEAQSWLFLLRLAQTVAADAPASIVVGTTKWAFDPSRPESHRKLAQMFADCGWSGRALATLEAGHERFPADPEILIRLAELYRQFGQPENAIPLYEAALQSATGDETATRGLQAAQFQLQKPLMEFPNGRGSHSVATIGIPQ